MTWRASSGSTGTSDSTLPTGNRILRGRTHDVAGAPFITFVHPDDQQETRRCLEMLTTGAAEAIEIENRFSRLDGTYARLSWHVSADRSEQLLYCRAQDLSSRTASAGGDVEVEARRRLDISDAVAVTDADDVLRVRVAVLPAAPRLHIGGVDRTTRVPADSS